MTNALRVAIVGAGALGSVYGVRLANRAGVDVTYVVRAKRLTDEAPLVIERARKSAERESLAGYARDVRAPADTDIVLVTVGTEDLDSLGDALVSTDAELVFLTPALPGDEARLRYAFGDRVVPALPSVVAYTRGDVVRYWLPPAPTRIEAESAAQRRAHGRPSPRARLAAAMKSAGFGISLERDVQTTNAATTCSFIAIGMAVAIAGSVDALKDDEALMNLTAEACREGVRLGDRIGKAEPWAALAPSLAAPWAMRLWIGALERFLPEGLFYFEEHFGRKLRAQHQAMAFEMARLADARGIPHEAIDTIAARLTA